jgi:hypothetical protein
VLIDLPVMYESGKFNESTAKAIQLRREINSFHQFQIVFHVDPHHTTFDAPEKST